MKMLRTLRRWYVWWKFAGSMRSLVNKHEKCCGLAAKAALEMVPEWGSNAFNKALEHAYNRSEGVCNLNGWQRRFVTLYWVARYLRMAW